MKFRPPALLTALFLLWITGSSVCGGTLVRFHTIFGDLMVELFDEEKPVTVENFLRYVESGHWTHLFTHRVVPGFIVQAGSFVTSHDPLRGDRIVRIPDFGPITNEFSKGPRRSNVYGTLAMAKKNGNPDSATADWFFNLADNSSELDQVDGGFTVFGRVIAGTNVLEAFNGFTWRLPLTAQPTNRLYYLGEAGPFNMFPLPPAFPVLQALQSVDHVYTNVIHIDVKVLPVEVKALTDRRAGIQWNVVPGIANHVEGADTPTGPWTPLSTLLTGPTPQEFIDTDPVVSRRYYRVRVGD